MSSGLIHAAHAGHAAAHAAGHAAHSAAHSAAHLSEHINAPHLPGHGPEQSLAKKEQKGQTEQKEQSLAKKEREKEKEKEREKKEAGPQLDDFYMGGQVFHKKHGSGRVSAFLAGGKVEIDFDNGDSHRYGGASLAKLEIIGNKGLGGDEEDEESQSIDLLADVLPVLPQYLMQGMLLWVPMAIFPPLRHSLSKHFSAAKADARRGVNPEGDLGFMLGVYLLEVHDACWPPA